MPYNQLMKTPAILVTLFLALVISTSVHAEKFSSFKGAHFYSAEGRWFIVDEKFLFKINEGNANEETILFEANPHQLANKIKYKICFKIKKDCQLTCRAQSIQMLKELKPWEDIIALVPGTNGQYFETTESTCKEAP